MVNKITFSQARTHYRRTHFDPLRMLVKRPLLLAVGSTAVGWLALVPGLVPGLAVSAAIEGIGYLANHQRRKENTNVLASLVETIKDLDSREIARELLESRGRGEKILAKKVLAELNTTQPQKYIEVRSLLESSYTGRKLLQLPFMLVTPQVAMSWRDPIISRGGMLLVPAVDQALKMSPISQTLDPNVSTLPEFAIMNALFLGGYKLAAGRRVAQTGLALMFWGSLSNMGDRLISSEITNYFLTNIPYVNNFNLSDVAITIGVILMSYGLARDK